MSKPWWVPRTSDPERVERWRRVWAYVTAHRGQHVTYRRARKELGLSEGAWHQSLMMLAAAGYVRLPGGKWLPPEVLVPFVEVKEGEEPCHG